MKQFLIKINHLHLSALPIIGSLNKKNNINKTKKKLSVYLIILIIFGWTPTTHILFFLIKNKFTMLKFYFKNLIQNRMNNEEKFLIL